MKITDKGVAIRLVTTDDATQAEAQLVESGFGPSMGFWPHGPTAHEAIAKRHPTDRPDHELGEALAAARALQAVVDDLWAEVKERCPDVQTPAERAAAKARGKAWSDGYDAGQQAHRLADQMLAYAKADVELTRRMMERRGRRPDVEEYGWTFVPGDPGPIGTERKSSEQPLWERLRRGGKGRGR